MKLIQAEAIRQMIESASNNLQNNRKYINDCNVFPVPDGDTGTNMGMTFGAAAETALETEADATVGKVLEVLAKSSLRNARGNSGVILSQILRGLSKGADVKEGLGIKEITAAAVSARDTAYRAVMKPTEGTILTVVREIAEFAVANQDKYEEPIEFLNAMVEAGRGSLNKTPEILPVLKKAGVVDAGGLGVMTLFEGAVFALQGKFVEPLEGAEIKTAKVEKAVDVQGEEIKYLYCTEFLINKSPDRQATQFTAAIQPKGDCMLVIEDDEIVKVHIHTNHPGFVIEQALKLGELTNLKIDNMKYQHDEKIEKETEENKAPEKRYGFVAVSAGPGLDEVFDSVGVDAIVEGGQTMNPSTQDLLNAVQKISAEYVFILPNNKNIILAAEHVNELSDREVIVIPTKNIPQGISAMLAFDEGAGVEENKENMIDMMQEVKCGQVTFAARDSAMDGFDIHEGDVMGITGGAICAVGEDLNKVSKELVASMIDDESGVVTIYYGADTDEATAKALEDALAEEYSDLDISLIYGGQPVYYYFLAVE